MIETTHFTNEYAMIREYYSDHRAARSNIPLMNHINEGLHILESLGAGEVAKRAFCLHPLVQGDAAIQENLDRILQSKQISIAALVMAMEYRRAANAYLCKPETDSWDIEEAKRNIGLLLPEIKHMLIADKVQNRKDFMAAHYGTHARSEQLLKYFNNWHEILGHPIESDVETCQQ